MSHALLLALMSSCLVLLCGCVPQSQEKQNPPSDQPPFWAHIPSALPTGEGECEPDLQPPPITACDWLSDHELVAVGRIVHVRADFDPLAVYHVDEGERVVGDADECLYISPWLEVDVELLDVFRGDASGVVTLNLPVDVVQGWFATPVTEYPSDAVGWSDGGSYAEEGGNLFFAAFAVGERHYSSWGLWPHLEPDGTLSFADNDCGTLHDSSLEAPIDEVLATWT